MFDAINKENFADINDLHHYYQSIIYNLPHLVYILDKDCSIIACNKNMLEFLEIKNFTELTTNLYTQLTVNRNFSATRMQKLKQDDINAILDLKETHAVEETPVVTADGTIMYFSAERTPLFNARQEIMGLLVCLVDKTEQRQMAEKIEKLTARLQNKTAEVSTNPVNYHPLNKAPRVLMIEDNAIAQKAVQALLMQLDCKVDVAESGEKALSFFKPGKYDLVFMDIGLEDGSGYVVSKKIRQIEENSGHRVPIIALTGYEADIVKTDCEEYFMEGAITKPLTSEQARQIIEHYIYHMDIPVFGLKTTKSSDI